MKKINDMVYHTVMNELFFDLNNSIEGFDLGNYCLESVLSFQDYNASTTPEGYISQAYAVINTRLKNKSTGKVE